MEHRISLVVYTCAFGGYDIPIKPAFRDSDVDFVCFTDNPALVPNGWKIVEVEQEPAEPLGNTRRSRKPKILPHRYLQDYERSLYIDANLEVTASLHPLFARLDDFPLVFFTHPEDREDIYAEAEICSRLGKDDPDLLRAQVDRYRALGFDGRAARDATAIPAGMVILRRHREPTVIAAMEKWWSEYLSGSNRDQISLPFALRQSGVSFGMINENVRSNTWMNWRPHYTADATKRRLKTYKKAGAIILHAPGAEIRLRRKLLGTAQNGQTLGDRLLRRVIGPPPEDIIFDDNILGIAPHGAPQINIVGAELLLKRPVALLCDDSKQREAHAVAAAKQRGARFDDESEIPRSPIYGTARRLEFEAAVKTFLESHPGPKVVLSDAKLARGNVRDLARWLQTQGRRSLPLSFSRFR